MKRCCLTALHVMRTTSCTKELVYPRSAAILAKIPHAHFGKDLTIAQHVFQVTEQTYTVTSARHPILFAKLLSLHLTLSIRYARTEISTQPAASSKTESQEQASANAKWPTALSVLFLSVSFVLLATTWLSTEPKSGVKHPL